MSFPTSKWHDTIWLIIWVNLFGLLYFRKHGYNFICKPSATTDFLQQHSSLFWHLQVLNCSSICVECWCYTKMTADRKQRHKVWFYHIPLVWRYSCPQVFLFPAHKLLANTPVSLHVRHKKHVRSVSNVYFLKRLSV